MAKKIGKQIKNIIKNRVDNAVEFGTRKTFLQGEGEELKRRLIVRTKTGKVVDENGKQRSMEKIAETTKQKRRFYSSKLDSTTRPNKTNLTATGQMLKSLKTEVKGLFINIVPKRRKMRNLSGGISSKSVDEVIGFHMEGTSKMPARPFFRSSLADLNNLQRKIRQEIFKGLGL